MIAAFSLALALWSAPAPALSPGDIESQIDAGKFADAAAAIEATELTPLARATLEGRLALAQGKPARAATKFAEAVRLAPEHPPLRLLWAHALLQANRPGEVVAALEPLDATDSAVAVLLAAAADAADDPAAAYDVLQAAARAHDDEIDLRRQLVLLCAREGLLAATQSWIETLTPEALGRDLTLVVLQEIRSDAHALPLARMLAGAFPDDPDVHAQLGWVASAAGATTEAARAFERAVRLGADESYAAAEHARAAGRHRDALRMNAQVADDAVRQTQRFDIVFESGALAQAIVAGEALEAAGRLDPRRRYNLAYAHYALQQYGEASALARALNDTDQASRGRRLLQAMGR